jgi:hypothetical protein
MSFQRFSYLVQGLCMLCLIPFYVSKYAATGNLFYAVMFTSCLMVAIANFKVCYDERNKS